MKISKQILLGIGIGFSVVLLLGLIKFIQIRNAMAQGGGGPPPVTVTTTKSQEDVWIPTFQAVGSINPHQGAILSAQDSGQIAKVLVEDGASVTEGQLLIQVDISVEEANLNEAKAELDRAAKNLERQKKLKEKNAVSLDALEAAQADYREARARVESFEARIKRKSVIAPFDGKVGIRNVNVGDYVNAGDPIIPLFDSSKLYVDFTVPQDLVSRIEIGRGVTVKTSAFPNEEFTGAISSFDPQVNLKTRNVSVRALISDTKGKLLPGLYADVSVPYGDPAKVIVVPQTAISYAPFGNSVYVVKSQESEEGVTHSVEQLIVKTGRKRGDLIEIVSGLESGVQIVSSGLFKLSNGLTVMINEVEEFNPSLTPEYQNS